MQEFERQCRMGAISASNGDMLPHLPSLNRIDSNKSDFPNLIAQPPNVSTFAATQGRLSFIPMKTSYQDHSPQIGPIKPSPTSFAPPPSIDIGNPFLKGISEVHTESSTEIGPTLKKQTTSLNTLLTSETSSSGGAHYSPSPDVRIANSKYRFSGEFAYEIQVHGPKGRERVDLAMMYAVPLMSKEGHQFKVLSTPVDYENEIQRLKGMFHDKGKEITLSFQIANHDNFETLLKESRPKILHISCHGDYDPDLQMYYLAFEDRRGEGLLDKFTTQKLEKLIGSTEDAGVDIVFVSACHSQLIGQILSDAGISCVIAVHSMSKILDEAAQDFANRFYRHLLDGKSIGNSFKRAKDYVESTQHHEPICCCVHTHKPNCKWEQKARQDGYRNAHYIHYPHCKCPISSNRHKHDCQWALDFLKKWSLNYQEQPTNSSPPILQRQLTHELMLTQNKEVEDAVHDSMKLEQLMKELNFNFGTDEGEIAGGNLQFQEPEKKNHRSERVPSAQLACLEKDNHLEEIKSKEQEELIVCCCSPEIPHNEAEKFCLIVQQKTVKKQVIFPDQPDGEPIDLDATPWHSTLHLEAPFVVGRNREMQQIVSFLIKPNQHYQNRLLNIHGPSTMGKTVLSKAAAKYAHERAGSHCQIHYIDLLSHRTCGSIVTKICTELGIPMATDEQLCQYIYRSPLVLIIDNIQGIQDADPSGFEEVIKYLINNSLQPKFLIISSQQIKFIFNHMKIEPLSPLFSAKLLLKLAEQQLPQNLQDPKRLAKHAIFNRLQGSPQRIHQVAGLLSHYSLDELASIHFLGEKKRKEVSTETPDGDISVQEEWLMRMSYNQIKALFPQYIHLLHILCQFQSGITELDLEAMIQFLREQEILCREDGLCGIRRKSLTLQEQVKSEEPQKVISWREFLSQLEQQNRTPSGVLTAMPVQVLDNAINYLIPLCFSNFVNRKVLSDLEWRRLQHQAVQFLSHQARIILRSMKTISSYRIIQLEDLSAAIDIGIWSEWYSHSVEEYRESYLEPISKPFERFEVSQGNFYFFLGKDQLGQVIRTPEVSEETLESIEDLSLTVVKILDICGRSKEAQILAQNCELEFKESERPLGHGRLALTLASMSLLEVIQNKCQRNQFMQKLGEAKRYVENEAQPTFNNAKNKEGNAECSLLLGFIAQAQAEHCAGYVPSNPQSNRALPIHQKSPTMAHSLSIDGRTINRSFSAHSGNSSTGVQRAMSSKQDFQGSSPMAGGEITVQKFSKKLSPGSYFEYAKNIYKDIMHRHGEARACLALASWKIDHDEIPNYRKLKDMLVKADQTFLEWDSTYFRSKTLRLLSKISLEMLQIKKAREYAEQARKESERIGDKKGESQATTDLGIILDFIRQQSHNVFVFVKAFPLVSIDTQSKKKVTPIGPRTRYPSEFRKELLRKLESQRKVISIHFDSLNRGVIQNIRKSGCRVLHLSSDVYVRDEPILACEGPCCEVDWLDSPTLFEMLTKGANKLNVDVVVMAMPKSRAIGELFATQLGVPHVVVFDFPIEFHGKYGSLFDTVNLEFECIYQFCIEFYSSLVEGNTIEHAASEGIHAMNELLYSRLYSQNQHFKIESVLEQHIIGTTPAIILPQVRDHHDRLFGGQDDFEVAGFDETELETGRIVDTSMRRAPSNLLKPITPFTGRNQEIHSALKALIAERKQIVNFVGPSGIGKSRLLQEIGYIMHSHHNYPDGLYFLSLKGIRNNEELKQRLTSHQLGGSKGFEMFDSKNSTDHGRIVLLFDDADSLLRPAALSKFEWWLFDIVSRCGISLIITSKTPLKDHTQLRFGRFTLDVQTITVPPLDDYEATDMLQALSDRSLSRREIQLLNELDFPPQADLRDRLASYPIVEEANGYPKFLSRIAKVMKQKQLFQVQPDQIFPRGLIKKPNKKDKGRRSKHSSSSSRNQSSSGIYNTSNGYKPEGRRKTIAFKPQAREEFLEEDIPRRPMKPNEPRGRKQSEEKVQNFTTHSKFAVIQEEDASIPDSPNVSRGPSSLEIIDHQAMKRNLSSITGIRNLDSESEYSLGRMDTSNAILEQSSSHVQQLHMDREEEKIESPGQKRRSIFDTAPATFTFPPKTGTIKGFMQSKEKESLFSRQESQKKVEKLRIESTREEEEHEEVKVQIKRTEVQEDEEKKEEEDDESQYVDEYDDFMFSEPSCSFDDFDLNQLRAAQSQSDYHLPKLDSDQFTTSLTIKSTGDQTNRQVKRQRAMKKQQKNNQKQQKSGKWTDRFGKKKQKHADKIHQEKEKRQGMK